MLLVVWPWGGRVSWSVSVFPPVKGDCMCSLTPLSIFSVLAAATAVPIFASAVTVIPKPKVFPTRFGKGCKEGCKFCF